MQIVKKYSSDVEIKPYQRDRIIKKLYGFQGISSEFWQSIVKTPDQRSGVFTISMVNRAKKIHPIPERKAQKHQNMCLPFSSRSYMPGG